MRHFFTLILLSLTVTVQALSLNHDKWCMHIGQTIHLIAYEQNDFAEPEDWQSSNPEVAKVDRNGVVTSLGEGTAVVTASIGTATASIEVTVTESKAFDITFSNITNTHCDYSVVPANPSVRYYYQMRLTHGDEYSIESMDDHGSQEENIFYFTYDWFDFCAGLYGNMTWNEVMQPQLEQGTVTGDNTDFYSVLTPGTEYTIYAMGFDADGNLVTPIEMASFTTTAPTASDITFNIHIGACHSNDAEFTVRPSNNDPYLVCVQKASYVEWFMERDRLDDMAQPLAESYATDVRYPALQQGVCMLHASDFVNVRSNADYYVIVFGYDDGVTSPVSVKHFYTQEGWTDGEGEDPDSVTPPVGLETQSCLFDAFDVYLDEKDEEVYAPIETMNGEIGIDGSDVYIYGMVGAMSERWVKGSFDASEGLLRIASPQMLGMFDPFGMGTVPLYLVGGDMTTNGLCDLVFHYDSDNLRFVLDENQYFLINGKPNAFEIYMMMAEYTITLSSPLGIQAIEALPSAQPELLLSPCLPAGFGILRTSDGRSHKVVVK